MNTLHTRAEQAALRRRQLMAEIAIQRIDLATQLHPLAHTLESARIGLRIAGRLRRHPEWIAAGALGLMLITPRRLSALLRAGTSGLRTWRVVGPQLRALLDRRG
jgi:hypothetical protein